MVAIPSIEHKLWKFVFYLRQKCWYLIPCIGNENNCFGRIKFKDFMNSLNSENTYWTYANEIPTGGEFKHAISDTTRLQALPLQSSFLRVSFPSNENKIPCSCLFLWIILFPNLCLYECFKNCVGRRVENTAVNLRRKISQQFL